MSAKEKALFEQIQRVGARFVALGRSLVFEYGEIKLYASEIHLMKTVDYNPDVNASGVAKLLGVTKGAVSQTVSRLEKKGILSREDAPLNGNELRLSLTPFGRGALEAFHTQNGRDWNDFVAYSESLPRAEYEAIIRYLARLEGFLETLA